MADQIVNYVRLAWAGGENKFHLRFDGGPKVGPLGLGFGVELHDRVRAILGRLMNGTWGVDDIERPITMGLIGGEDFPAGRYSAADRPFPAVHDLVKKHVLTRPLAESLPLAQCILIAAIMGVPAKEANRVRSVEDYQAEVEVDG